MCHIGGFPLRFCWLFGRPRSHAANISVAPRESGGAGGGRPPRFASPARTAVVLPVLVGGYRSCEPVSARASVQDRRAGVSRKRLQPHPCGGVKGSPAETRRHRPVLVVFRCSPLDRSVAARLLPACAPRSRLGQKCAGSTPNLDRLRKVVRSRLQLGRECSAATQQLRPRIPASPTCTRASRRRRDGSGSASNYRPRATRDFASRSHRPACQACSTAIRPNFCAAA